VRAGGCQKYDARHASSSCGRYLDLNGAAVNEHRCVLRLNELLSRIAKEGHRRHGAFKWWHHVIGFVNVALRFSYELQCKGFGFIGTNARALDSSGKDI
jgi:hypothetical protein